MDVKKNDLVMVVGTRLVIVVGIWVVEIEVMVLVRNSVVVSRDILMSVVVVVVGCTEVR